MNSTNRPQRIKQGPQPKAMKISAELGVPGRGASFFRGLRHKIYEIYCLPVHGMLLKSLHAVAAHRRCSGWCSRNHGILKVSTGSGDQATSACSWPFSQAPIAALKLMSLGCRFNSGMQLKSARACCHLPHFSPQLPPQHNELDAPLINRLAQEPETIQTLQATSNPRLNFGRTRRGKLKFEKPKSLNAPESLRTRA